MDMNVDEPGHDEAPGRVDDLGTRGSNGRGFNGGNAVGVHDNGTAFLNPVREDDRTAAEDDHCAMSTSPRQSTCTWILRPSNGNDSERNTSRSRRLRRFR